MDNKQKTKDSLKIALSLNFVQLLSVKANVIMENEDDIKTKRKNDIKSIEINDNEVSVTVFDNLTAVTDVDETITIELEAVANFDFKCDKSLDVATLQKNDEFIDTATDAAFSVTSLMLGILTDKMSCVQPMIMPPFLMRNLK